jgi:hypothetical protein
MGTTIESSWENAQLAEESAKLRAIVVECRSSVKFDLLHYEKMARAYGNLGREGEQTAAIAGAEAQRLNELLAKIDALDAPNVLADRREPIGEASSPKGDGRAAG